jgi:hypothetical protein
MRVRIHDRQLLPEFVAFLDTTGDTIVTAVGENELEVSLTSSMNAEAHESELVRRLQRWESAPGVAGRVEIVQ